MEKSNLNLDINSDINSDISKGEVKSGRDVGSSDEIKKEICLLVENYYDVTFKNKELRLGKDLIQPSGKKFDAEEFKLLVEASLDGWWTEGRFTKKFERKMGEFVPVKHVLTTNSGSSANLLALSALTSPKLGERRIRPGDEVIGVAACFPTTVNPIIQVGCIPVLLDIDKETYNVNVELLEKAVGPKTKAIFIAHTLGNPYNLPRVVDIARRYNLWLIEDCCDALGSRYGNQMVGTFGDLATFSFYPAHQITMGEGGAVITNDNLLAQEIRSFRDWGRDCWCPPGCQNTCGKRFQWQLGQLPSGYDHKYIYSNLGYNLKLTDMQAALGLAQLEKLPSFIEKRKENFSLLWQGLSKFQHYLQLPRATEHADPCWFGFLLSLTKNCLFSREKLTQYLNERGVGTRLLFSGNITKQPYFESVTYRVVGTLENSDYAMNNTFWIGVHPSITKEHISYMVHCFEEFFRNERL